MEWTSQVKMRFEAVCVHSDMQKKGGKMLHLKERETKETGERRLVFPPFSNEVGEIKK